MVNTDIESQKMRKKPAFSLIELMLVIAILAIVATMALPAYKQYTMKSRFQSLAPVVDALMQRSITYSMEFGHFPSARELGYAEDPNNAGEDRATPGTDITEYVTGVTPEAVWIGGGPATCGDKTQITFILNPQALGFSSDVTYADLDCFIHHIDNNYQKTCLYSYGGTASNPEELFPFWINENTGTNWDNTNYAITDALSAQATCQ